MARRNVIGFVQNIRNAANTRVARPMTASSCHEQFYRLHHSIIHEATSPLTRVVGPIAFRFCPHYSSSDFKQHCWKCKKEINPKRDQYFCGCGLIQPPVQERTYFGVVNMNEAFDIDTKEMARNFRTLQAQLHPDKFAQKSEMEKEYSAQQSASLNKAYFTLLKPLSRGLYMLKLHGHSIEESDIQADPDFLMEIMEINEDLVEADTVAKVQAIREANAKHLDQYIKLTSEALNKKDYEEAKRHLTKLKYYSNIDDKAKDLEMLFLDKM